MDNTKAPDGGSGGRAKEKNQNIQVFVRVRPMNAQENAKHSAEIIDTPGSREVVVKERAASNVTKTFTFDRVFGPRSKQIDVYKQVVSPLLSEVLLGYNCTVFAYGQTGTGKTFTMEGERKSNSGIESDPCAGILPRALSQLFDELRLMDCEFSVRVSFLELYNEELFDLLAPIDENKAKTLRLFEDAARKGSVIIQGLEEVIVNNKHEVYTVLDRGSQQRKTAATLMNATSSRSHTIFTITVHIRESSVEGEEMVKVGKLHLVDLAGSENIGKSGAVDKRAREAGSINQSLLTLGRVISALVERTPHIPYRESKLTRLLQDSLGGKTKTSIIATISPAVTNIEETLSTLDYAHRAKNIMNRPEVNQKISKKEVINMYTDEIDRLRKDLIAARDKNGFYMDYDNYNQLNCQIQSQNRELNEKSNKIRELEETVTSKEDELRESNELISDLQLDVKTKQTILDSLQDQKKKLETKLSVYSRKNDELKHLLKYHEDTEQKMSSEATTLLDTANDTVSIIEQLHGRLERKQNVEQNNWKNSERFREDFGRAVDNIIDNVNDMKQKHTIGISNLRTLLSKRNAHRKDDIHSYTSLFHATTGRMETLTLALNGMSDKLVSITQARLDSISQYIVQENENGQDKLATDMGILTASLESLKKQFESVKADLQNLQIGIEQNFNGMQEVVTQTLKSNVSRFNLTENALIELREKWGDVMTDIAAKCHSAQQDHAHFKSDYNQKIANLCSGLFDLRTDAEQHIEKTGTAFSYITNKMAECKEEIVADIAKETNNIKMTKVPTETMLQKSEQFRMDNVVSHQYVLGRMHDRMMREDSNFTEILARADHLSKDVKDSLCSTSSVVDTIGRDTIDELTQIHVSMSDMVEQHFAEISRLKNNSFDAMNRLTNGEDHCIGELVKITDEQCDNISTGCTEVTACLAHTSGSVDEFWEQTYVTDGRTGQTPMRRKFEFPTSLSMPSPSSRVISRYRNLRTDVQHVINECGDDSDMNSTASTMIDYPLSSRSEDDNLDSISLLSNNNVENEDPDKNEETDAASEGDQTNGVAGVSRESPDENKAPPAKEGKKTPPTKEELAKEDKKTPPTKEEPGTEKKKTPITKEDLVKLSCVLLQTTPGQRQKVSPVEKEQAEAQKPVAGRVGKKNKNKRKSGGGQKGVLKPPN